LHLRGSQHEAGELTFSGIKGDVTSIAIRESEAGLGLVRDLTTCKQRNTSEMKADLMDDATVIEDTARIHGDVTLGRGCYVLFGAVLRADGGAKCRVGNNCNIQDNAVLHGDPGFDTVLEENVSVGHGAVVHGCHIGANTIVGMKSVVLNGAKVGRGCLIGAGESRM
jgi:carbonic anhydrase/acetyltransferase-like protein (isoleucine patch superfamily)